MLRGSDGSGRPPAEESAPLQLGAIPPTLSLVYTSRQRRLLKTKRYINIKIESAALYSLDDNLLITGEPVYEAVRPISAGTELVVFYLPGLSDDEEEMLYGGLPAVRSLRSSLFRRTMGLILQGTTSRNVKSLDGFLVLATLH